MFSKINKIKLMQLVFLVVFIGLTVPAIFSTASIYLVQKGELEKTYSNDMSRLLNIVALSSNQPLWNLDNISQKKILDSALLDSRVVSIEVFDNKNKSFEKTAPKEKASGDLVNIEKVVERDGKNIGSVKLTYSLTQLKQILAGLVAKLILSSVAQLVVCFVLIYSVVLNRIVKRLFKVKEQSEKISQKKLDENFVWEGGDEISDLGRSLNSTRLSLVNLFKELENKNIELKDLNAGLEDLVMQRTQTIRMILDNVKNGFFVIDQNRSIMGGYSKSCEDLLGTKEIEGHLLNNVLKMDDKTSGLFDVNIDQVFEDILPEELSLSQVPGKFMVNGKILQLQGSCIREADGAVSKILFSVTDVTQLERAYLENMKNKSIIRILLNIYAFKDYLKEFKVRIASASEAQRQGEEKLLRMQLHTLKGNSASYGLTDLVNIIHEVEEINHITSEDVKKCEDSLIKFLDENYSALGVAYHSDEQERLTLSEEEFKELEQQIKVLESKGVDVTMLNYLINNLKNVTLVSLLGPLEEYVGTTSNRLGKQVDLDLKNKEFKVDPKCKKVFQNFTHLIRNSLDHGIEHPEVRANRGKSPSGKIMIDIFNESNGLKIIFMDDGNGLDTNRIRSKAIEKNMISEDQVMNDEETLNLIFTDRFSTSETVGDISGRGVGMGAVKHAVEELGGTIKVETEVGNFAKFTISIPHAS